jgi:hypothetical protein
MKKQIRDENVDYILSWISEIAPNLKKKTTFKQWISGFEDRYSKIIKCGNNQIKLYELMEIYWNKS